MKEPICIASRGRYINGKDGETEQRFEVNNTGVSNALTTVQKDYYVGEPVIQGDENMNNLIEPIAYDEQNDYLRKDGCVGTLTTDGSSPKHNNRILEPSYRIRKLTPIECWKLQGLTKEDCQKAKDVGVADGNLYKAAGNGLVTNCIQLIFEHLYKSLYDNTYVCTDERMNNIVD